MFPFQRETTHRVVVELQVLVLKPLRLVTTAAIVTTKLTPMSVLMTAVATIAVWFPLLPTMTVKTQGILVFTCERPARLAVIKIHAPDKALGHMAVIAFECTENALWMRVLMAAFATCHMDRTELLFPLMTFCAINLSVFAVKPK